MVSSRRIAALATIILLLCWGCAAPNRPSQPPAAPRAKVEAAPRSQDRVVSRPKAAPKAAPAVAANAVRDVPALGLRVEPVTGIDMRSLHMQYGRWQVISVAAVTPGSVAEQMGLKPKDVLLSANYRDIKSTDEFQNALAALSAGDKVVLLVSRTGEKVPRFITGTLGKAPGLAAAAPLPQPPAKAGPAADGAPARIFAPTGHHRILSIGLSADGQQAIAGGDTGNSLRLWDIAAGKERSVFAGEAGKNLYAVALSPDGRHALSGGADQTVILWETATGKALRTFSGHGGLILSVAFSPDGRQVASSSRDHTIKLWDLASGKEIRTLSGHSDGVKSIVYAPDGRHLLSGSFDKTVRLWDTATGRATRTLTGHAYQVASVALTPDGRVALSRSGDRIVKLWDLGTGEAIRTFSVDDVDATGRPLGDQGVVSGAFSPDGRSLLTTDRRGTIKLWDVAAGKAIRTFSGHTGWTQAVGFSRDMKRVVSGGNDGTLRLWDIDTGREVSQSISLRDGEWIVLTPEGYYNASQKAHEYLHIRMGAKVYGIDQFYDVFYRPDIVAAKLRGDDIGKLVTLTIDEAIRNPPPAVEFAPLAPQTGQERVTVCYRVRSTGGGIGEVRLFHNGKLIESDGYYRDVAKASEITSLAALTGDRIYADMRSVQVKGLAEASAVQSKAKGEQFAECKTVDAIPGENEISLSAFNAGNSVQSAMQTARFNAAITPGEPRIYILSIGIDQYRDGSVNLKYAVKDARDMAARLATQSATLYRPDHIHHELIRDGEGTKTTILGRIDAVAQKIKPYDHFILFVAGHGLLLQNQYYMLTHDYAGRPEEANMISSNEIVEMSKRIKSLNQLLIFDTCHAGGVDYIVSGLYDARMSVLAKKMGLHIYASASDKEAAMDGYRGNGLFTHVLLRGLNDNREADRHQEGKVSVVGLGDYSKKVTTDLSQEIGHRQTPLMIHFGKDHPLYRLP